MISSDGKGGSVGRLGQSCFFVRVWDFVKYIEVSKENLTSRIAVHSRVSF